jgi:hypothetical protein
MRFENLIGPAKLKMFSVHNNSVQKKVACGSIIAIKQESQAF